MRQILLLVLLFVVGQWLVKALRRAQRPDATGNARQSSGAQQGAGHAPGGAPNGRPNGARGPAPRRLAEPMIRCAECGVHAPQSDSVSLGGEVFCCSDHAQRYAARVAQARGREGR
jgi:uncharacterized protein